MAEENNTQAERQFNIQKIYVKDVSFETPNSPDIFTLTWEPEVEFNLSSSAAQIQDNVYQVSLTVTLTVKITQKQLTWSKSPNLASSAPWALPMKKWVTSSAATARTSCFPTPARSYRIWSVKGASPRCFWPRSTSMDFMHNTSSRCSRTQSLSPVTKAPCLMAPPCPLNPRCGALAR